MIFKKFYIITIFCAFYIGLFSQNTLTIDFANYKTAKFQQSNCTYEIQGIPIQFYNIYGGRNNDQDTLCSTSPTQDDPAYKAKIKKSDLPLKGTVIELSIANIKEDDEINFFEYELHYNNGEVIKDNGASILIRNYQALNYFTITEIECSLTRNPRCGILSPVIIQLKVKD